MNKLTHVYSSRVLNKESEVYLVWGGGGTRDSNELAEECSHVNSKNQEKNTVNGVYIPQPDSS